MNTEIIDAGRDISGGYKVDVSRGTLERDQTKTRLVSHHSAKCSWNSDRTPSVATECNRGKPCSDCNSSPAT